MRVCLGFGGVFCFLSVVVSVCCIYGLVLQPFYFGFVFSVVVEWSSPRRSRCERLRGRGLVPICWAWGFPTAGVQRLVVAVTVRARARSGCGHGSPECAEVEDESSVPAVVGGPLPPCPGRFFLLSKCVPCVVPPFVFLLSLCLPISCHFILVFAPPPSLLPPAFPSAP